MEEKLTQPSRRPPDVEKRIRRKRFFRRARLIAVLLLVVFVAGLAVAGFLTLAPNVQTQTAMPATMTDSIDGDGYAILAGVQIVAQQSGHLYYTVQTGERVVVGAAVADVYAGESGVEARATLDRLTAEMEQLEAVQGSFVESGDVEGLIEQRQTDAYQLMNAIDTGNYANVQTPLAAVTATCNKLHIATEDNADFSGLMQQLASQKAQIESQAVAQGNIVAPQGGYFVPSKKYDRIMAGYDEVAQMSPQEMQTAMQATPQYYPANVVGHIVSDYKWTLFVLVPFGQAQRFTEGAKLSVAFPEYGEAALPVKVQAVTEDENAGLAKVELLCEYINPTVLSLRQEKVQIIFQEMKGIRIDKKALRIIEGEYGVFIKTGNTVRYRKIKILLENEHYVLIPDTVQAGVNEVALYDEVIVDNGGLELYDQRIL